MGIEFFYEDAKPYSNGQDVMKDLNLNFIARNMANDKYGDIPFITEVLQHPLRDIDSILKRQQIVMAACDNYALMQELREIIVDTSECLDRHMKAIQDCRGKHMTKETNIGIYTEAVRHLVFGLAHTAQCMEVNEKLFQKGPFHNFYEGFYREETAEELEEQKYLVTHLDSFKSKGEILVRVSIGEGFRFRDMHILDVSEKASRVSVGFFATRKTPVIVDEDVYDSSVEAVNQTIQELLESCFPFLQRWQGLLHTMKRQIMFLNACAGFYARGKEKGMYFCIPKNPDATAEKLYELSLALQTLTLPIHNTVSITKYKAIIVTGANQGGKSTFLRSLGIAQVMCQAGMYVPARDYPLRAYQDIFPHFTRREDSTMNMGKFEEELHRMSDILEKSGPDTLLLLNESFATTTEVTAYQIAIDLLHASMETGRTIWMVTHITTFAKAFYREENKEVLFLSAGRNKNPGELQYRMAERPPEDTSYGLELFEQMIDLDSAT